MYLSSGGDDIKIWDIRTWSVVKQYNPHGNNVSAVLWSTDDDCLASAASLSDQISLTCVENEAQSSNISVEGGKSCISFNSNSRYILGGGADSMVQIWDLKSNILKKTYKGHKSNVTSVAFNWNDTMIASSSAAGEIILHSLATAIAYSPFTVSQNQAVRKIQYNRYQTSMLAAASDDGSISLWDSSSKKLIHLFKKAHKAPAQDLAFSPLNKMLLISVGLDKRILCCDVIGQSPVKTITAEGPLTSLDMMNDGATFTVGSTRGNIYVYDLRLGDKPVTTLTAHKCSVQSLSFQNGAKQQKSPEDFLGKSTAVSSPLVDSNAMNNNFFETRQKKATVDNEEPQFADVQNTAASLSENDEIFSPLHENVNISNRSSFGSSSIMDHIPSCKLSQPDNSSFSKREKAGGKTTSGIQEKVNKQGTASKYAPKLSCNGDIFQESMSSDTLQHSSSKYQYFEGGEGIPTVKQTTSSDNPNSISSDSVQLNVSNQGMLVDSVDTFEDNLACAWKQENKTPSNPPQAFPNCAPNQQDTALQPFQMQIIKNAVENSLEDFREQIRHDMLGLHMEMIKQFMIQKQEVEQICKQHSINEDLLAEVQRLRKENQTLKNHCLKDFNFNSNHN